MKDAKKVILVGEFQPFSSRVGVDTVIGLKCVYSPAVVALLKKLVRREKDRLQKGGREQLENMGGWLVHHKKWFIERLVWPAVGRGLLQEGYKLEAENPALLEVLEMPAVGCSSNGRAEIDQQADRHLRSIAGEGRETEAAVKIYLAGKIRKNCWRHLVVKGLREALNHITTCCPSDADWITFEQIWDGEPPRPTWPVLEKSILQQHSYVGPFFVSCDHGCYHGSDSHGLNAQSMVADFARGHNFADLASVVVDYCLRAVDACDLFFAWLETPDCYGTLAELGYAYAKGKAIVVATPYREFLKDHWFALEMAKQTYFGHPLEKALRMAVDGFVKSKRRPNDANPYPYGDEEE